MNVKDVPVHFIQSSSDHEAFQDVLVLTRKYKRYITPVRGRFVVKYVPSKNHIKEFFALHESTKKNITYCVECGIPFNSKEFVIYIDINRWVDFLISRKAIDDGDIHDFLPSSSYYQSPEISGEVLEEDC